MFRHEIVITKGLLPFNVIIHNQAAVKITKHWHRSIEIDYTINGDGDYFVLGKKTHIGNNDFIIINSGDVHGVEHIEPKSGRQSLTLLIPYETILKLSPNFDHFYFISTNSDKQKMDKVRKELASIYHIWTQEQSKFAAIDVLGHFYLLMSCLLKHFTIPKNQILSFNDSKKQGKIKQVINFLSQNYQDELTLDQISDHFNLSKAYLDRLFQKEIGTSLIKYLQMIRLQHAFQIIANTQLPINVIADQCGFANVKSLQKLFKQVYEMTPRQYRKAQISQ